MSPVTLRTVLLEVGVTSDIASSLSSSPNVSASSLPTPPEHLCGPHQSPNAGRDNFDAFADFRFREFCQISSLDLHTPFEPLCKDKKSLLEAMSFGGRPGFDAPYIPRGCDMRWYTTSEACEIVERFDRIGVVGDSMMRQMVGALFVLLRKDLGYGAVHQWQFSEAQKFNCFCDAQVNVHNCNDESIFSTSDIYANDPSSFACNHNKTNIFLHIQLKHPLPQNELDRLALHLDGIEKGKQVAMVFGHGLWNDLNAEATIGFLNSSELAIATKLPGNGISDTTTYPRLFVTPNAAGENKQDFFIVTQGNKPLVHFERKMYELLPPRGYDVLGTWNMSVQTSMVDGVHSELRANLVKAMMLLNWLDAVGVPSEK
ncbi:uncharacterized protein V1518DRAFT_375171 [Limtongia smithiae]|uniref:uncharacterized protein n=1 Tax=Limtongia smithiae TaxID=1125753 RepID=UPI0034CE4A26